MMQGVGPARLLKEDAELLILEAFKSTRNLKPYKPND